VARWARSAATAATRAGGDTKPQSEQAGQTAGMVGAVVVAFIFVHSRFVDRNSIDRTPYAKV
jgi:hypothetical protein